MDEKKRYAVVNAFGWVSVETESLEIARYMAAVRERNEFAKGPHRVVELVPVPDPLPTAVGSVVKAGERMFARGTENVDECHWADLEGLGWISDNEVTFRGPVTVLFDAATTGGDSDE